MKRTTIENYFIIFLGLTLFSCANSKSNKENTNFAFRLIKTEKLTEYKLLSYANKFDTVLVVAKNNIMENCIKENLMKISLQNNNKIYSLNDNGEKISFVYYTKGGENNNLKILTGSGKPGSSKKQINSYNSLPYFVENCREIK